MHADPLTPPDSGSEAARLVQEELDPLVPPPARREVLLKRALARTGAGAPLTLVTPPEEPPKAG
jgi:hypothetical protein